MLLLWCVQNILSTKHVWGELAFRSCKILLVNFEEALFASVGGKSFKALTACRAALHMNSCLISEIATYTGKKRETACRAVSPSSIFGSTQSTRSLVRICTCIYMSEMGHRALRTIRIACNCSRSECQGFYSQKQTSILLSSFTALPAGCHNAPLMWSLWKPQAHGGSQFLLSPLPRQMRSGALQ